MNSIILYVIRHGKTICNEKRLYCGKTDISLCDNGRKELLELKEHINYPKVNLYYTSGAKRSNETMDILFEKANYKENRGFFEFDFGDFEMKSYEILKEDKRYINWIVDKTNMVKCPNGESKVEFIERISTALKELIADIIKIGEREALLICHGGTIGTLIETYGNTNKDFYTLQPNGGRGYKLEINISDDDIKIQIIEEI